MKKRRGWTVMVVDDHEEGAVRAYRLSQRLLSAAFASLSLILTVLSALSVGYFLTESPRTAERPPSVSSVVEASDAIFLSELNTLGNRVFLLESILAESPERVVLLARIEERLTWIEEKQENTFQLLLLTLGGVFAAAVGILVRSVRVVRSTTPEAT